MSNATDKFVEKWEKNLAIGRKMYAVKKGIVWGLIVGTLSHLINIFIISSETEFSLKEIISKVIIFIITGIILHYFFMWKTYNNQYNKLKNKS